MLKAALSGWDSLCRGKNLIGRKSKVVRQQFCCTWIKAADLFSLCVQVAARSLLEVAQMWTFVRMLKSNFNTISPKNINGVHKYKNKPERMFCVQLDHWVFIIFSRDDEDSLWAQSCAVCHWKSFFCFFFYSLTVTTQAPALPRHRGATWNTKE